MQNLKILNNKEKKHILSLIKKQWDADLELDYVFLKNNKERIYMVNKDMANIDESRLRINSLGLYIGELRNNELRLSIEGSQLIGPHAKKNVLELKNSRVWLKGYDLPTKDENSETFVIIKNKEDYFGCGKIREGKILNFISKTRRLNSSD